MTPEMKEQADAQFRAEVTSHYTDNVERALGETLTQVRSALAAWSAVPGYKAPVQQIHASLKQAFGTVWPTTIRATMDKSDALVARATVIDTLINARSAYSGYKNQMLNPQVLAKQAIEKRVAESCDQHGVIYEGSQLQKAVREAMQPLSKLPQLVDMQGMGL